MLKFHSVDQNSNNLTLRVLKFDFLNNEIEVCIDEFVTSKI